METQIRRKNMLIIPHRNQEALTIDVFKDQDPPFALTQRNEFQSRDWNRPARHLFVVVRKRAKIDQQGKFPNLGNLTAFNHSIYRRE